MIESIIDLVITMLENPQCHQFTITIPCHRIFNLSQQDMFYTVPNCAGDGDERVQSSSIETIKSNATTTVTSVTNPSSAQQIRPFQCSTTKFNSKLPKINQKLPNLTNHYDLSFEPNCDASSTPVLRRQYIQQPSVKQGLINDKILVDNINDSPIEKTPESYVGFATLPDQLHRRAVKKGFSFNLMVVGESGLGKSTFINSLFLSELYKIQNEDNKVSAGSNSKIVKSLSSLPKTVSVRSNKIRLTENLVSLDLTLIDTPGFGDALDNSGCWEPLVSFIDNMYEEYLNAETAVDRSLPIPDKRVHCCLYFISPTGHGLRNIDVELMKRLDSKVNIIPIIAKSDTLTSDELRKFKDVIRQDLSREQINIFDFSECHLPNRIDGKLPPIVGQQKRPAPSTLLSPPFAVVGSNCVVEKDGVFVRGREYPWGFVNVECTDHCDFIPLRKLLIRSHMCDIKEKTHNVHYETFRAKRLSDVILDASIPLNERTLLSKIEEDTKENEDIIQQMEADMQEVFDAKVAEKLKKLEESRENVRKTYDNYRKAIEEESKRIESRRAEFEKERCSEFDYVSLKSEASSNTCKQRKSFF
ncbi:hypothetical protein GJ496_011550 [Pomphorhynchus laevis]|nr:hypothetical protein GJ496_011550 [Pomphorhynchus laevis]